MAEDLVRLVTSFGCFGFGLAGMIGIVNIDGPPASRFFCVLIAVAFFLLGVGCLRKPAGNRRTDEPVPTAQRSNMKGHVMWLNALVNLFLMIFGFFVGVAAWLSAFPGPRSDFRWLWWVGGIVGLMIGRWMAEALTAVSRITGTQGSLSRPTSAVKVALPPEPVQPVVIGQSKLTTCPDCQRQVSRRAHSCPGCGAPLQPDSPTADDRT